MAQGKSSTGAVDRSALLGKDYWLAWSTPAATTTAGDIAEHVDDHLRWLLDLETAGILLLSGPLLEGETVGPGSGVTVLRATDQGEARLIAERDPFVHAGLRTVEVYRWRVNEGCIRINLQLGTGRYTWE